MREPHGGREEGCRHRRVRRGGCGKEPLAVPGSLTPGVNLYLNAFQDFCKALVDLVGSRPRPVRPLGREGGLPGGAMAGLCLRPRAEGVVFVSLGLEEIGFCAAGALPVLTSGFKASTHHLQIIPCTSVESYSYFFSAQVVKKKIVTGLCSTRFMLQSLGHSHGC